MAISAVGIANIALTMLSTSRITSLDEDNENARKVNAIYNSTRDSLLAEHNWNFARAQAELSQLDETPTLSDWSLVFQVPTDVIRIIRIDCDEKFAIYGSKLYTNSSSVKIDYIKRIESESMFSSAFVIAFASRLAMVLSYGITQSSTQTQLMADYYKNALQEAKWADAQEGVGTLPLSGSFIQSRGY